MTTPQAEQAKYFNLHTAGIGYLNRARLVKIKKGTPFLAVDVVALHGDPSEPNRTRFDCRVSGQSAQVCVDQLMLLINDRNAKVLVAFKLGDLYAETFVYEKGDNAGETGISLKARLLKLDWVKVNGVPFVLPAEESAESEPAVPGAMMQGGMTEFGELITD